MPHQPRTEVLTDKAFVAIIGPDVAQDAHHVAVPGDLRKPLAILVIRIGNDTLNVLHHRKAERIGVEAGEARIVEIRLEYDVGVRLQEFEEIAVGDPSLFVQPLHDAVMDVGRGALVHHLGLALRIEILRDVAHDPQQFALHFSGGQGGLCLGDFGRLGGHFFWNGRGVEQCQLLLLFR